ncbi:hypothetical protein [Microvirga tunisiensis]|uniref:Uncharacterized protein n=1 Tax=Microvirga tunisiensis TaxID=2108360 RepID=A0A5N7MB12_9HYPH|nr:hypothetical protein [Microvirga tunisiensis]MPR05620.1 hypothetical protein [Microvirga tunisiensis]MPR23820.1 hypothetical protein [Microvirga tunisiensis]
MLNLAFENDGEERQGFMKMFSSLADEGLKNASKGFSEFVSGHEIGAPSAPESNRGQQSERFYATALAAADRGMDELAGKGFEQGCHRAAAELFHAQEARPAKSRTSAGRDFD